MHMIRIALCIENGGLKWSDQGVAPVDPGEFFVEVIDGYGIIIDTANRDGIYVRWLNPITVSTHLLGERMERPDGRPVGGPSAACSVASRSSPRLRAVSSTVVKTA
jgi:hypothetical protein